MLECPCSMFPATGLSRPASILDHNLCCDLCTASDCAGSLQVTGTNIPPSMLGTMAKHMI